MSWCVNHWHESTNERHSLSQPLRAASSLREGAGNGLHHSSDYSLKSGVTGDFHRPYGAQKTFPYTIQPADLLSEKSMVIIKTCPHSRQEKPIDKTLCTCYNTWELTEKFPISYRGVEQLEARRAHNPEVVGSSPASATKIIPDFGKKSGIFLTFYTNLRCFQICFGDSSKSGVGKPKLFYRK